MSDSTQGRDFAAPATVLASGTAKVPVNVAIGAGDSVRIVLANVTNPPAGTVSDFAVHTTADIAPADATPYTVSTAPPSTTTTTTVPSTTTRPKPVPAVTALTTRAAVPGNKVELRLRCGGATCQGTIWLNCGRTSLAKKSYGMAVGTTSAWTTYLNKEAVHLLARARCHTLKATETVTVSDGPTVHRQITLVD